ncbi:hypothetical protein DFJ74DRAFT_668055 [Hyaloraphidium curvatum]|nr:hypothetical protein DFJ74DRAFT_668055 [Hyaloraphidium curvatum]
MLRLLAAVCLAGLFLAPAADAAPRVRKELRAMTDAEYRALLTGLRTMISTNTTAGRARYGPLYKDYDYFIVKHAVATNDPRGDQGHNGPNFMTFHRAWLLELERSLLAVAPAMRALPYLDITADLKGGRYFRTSRWVFSNRYAGSIDCASGVARGCRVTDGAFPNKRVSRFDNATYAAYASIYNGSRITGLLRGSDNPNASPFLTRFPNRNNAPQAAAFKSWAPVAAVWLNTRTGISAASSWNYTAADFARCAAFPGVRNWLEWNYCNDFTSFVFAFNRTTYLDRFARGMASTLHAGVHWIAGGSNAIFASGDMKDTVTSPNEPLLFFLHHANLDRSARIWARRAARGDPALARRAFGYPRSKAEYPQSFAGCYLNDVVSSNFPFSDIFDGQTKPATHADLMRLATLDAIYTYDRMTA